MPIAMRFRRNQEVAATTMDPGDVDADLPPDGRGVGRSDQQTGTSGRSSAAKQRTPSIAPISRARINGFAGLCMLLLVVSGLGLPVPGGHLAADAILVVVGFQLGLGVVRLADRTPTWRRRFWLSALGPVVVPTLVAVTLAVAYWWWLDRLGPAETRGAVASLAMATNVTPLLPDAGFAATEHLWLISLIVQFAVVVPLAAVITRRPHGRRALLRLVVTLVAAVAVVRLTLAMTGLVEPSTLAQLTVTRMDGLLLGLGVAVAPRWLLDRLTWATGPLAMAVLITVFALAPDPATRPVLALGLLTPVAIVATAVVVATRHPASDDLLSRFLGGLGPRWLGERAISIYVWHRLFGMALSDELSTGIFGAEWPGYGLFTTRLVFALAAGAASYRYLQLPLRGGVERLLGRRRRGAGRSGQPARSAALSPS